MAKNSLFRYLLLFIATIAIFSTVSSHVLSSDDVISPTLISLSESTSAISTTSLGPSKSFLIGPYKTIHPYAPLRDPEGEEEEGGDEDYPYYFRQNDGKWTKVLGPWSYRMEEPHPRAKNILKKSERAYQIRQSKLRYQRKRLGTYNEEENPEWLEDQDFEDEEAAEEEQLNAQKKREAALDKVMEKINRQNNRYHRRMARLLLKERRKRAKAERKMKKLRGKKSRRGKRRS